MEMIKKREILNIDNKEVGEGETQVIKSMIKGENL